MVNIKVVYIIIIMFVISYNITGMKKIHLLENTSNHGVL